MRGGAFALTAIAVMLFTSTAMAFPGERDRLLQGHGRSRDAGATGGRVAWIA